MWSLAAALLTLSFTGIHALVEFRDSRLYDEVDFAAGTVFLPNFCTVGCRIYVSMPDSSMQIAKNIKVHDYWDMHDYSLYDLSTMQNGDEKGYYQVEEGNAQVNFLNTNSGSATAPMAVWVVRGRPENYDALVFDASRLDMVNGRSLDIVTVMSATPFTLTSNTTASTLMVSSLAGYDALNQPDDQCITAFQQLEVDAFENFRIGVQSPLISFMFDDTDYPDTSISLSAKAGLDASYDFSGPSFVAAPGFIGCKGGQTFRSSLYATTSTYRYTSLNKNRFYDVSMTSELNTDEAHPVTISDVTNGQQHKMSGNKAENTNVQNLILQQTNNLELSWTRNNKAPQQSFLIRITPSMEKEQATTPTAPIRTTSIAQSVGNVDNYCKCALVNDWFDGWNPSDIWVDVVILLDISASMGDSLPEAKSLVTSFVHLLSTDASAEFYSRVGVITVADSVQEIYSLNMSSTDNLKMITQSDVSTADIAAGIEAARSMFSNGMVANRKNARQIIYYLTNSAPGSNMAAANDFKNGGGIIIVNDYVSEGDVATTGLKSVASDNFYFTDLNENYIRTLALFCDANCFCNSNKHAFNEDKMNPRTQANRGCFHPVDNGIPFEMARDTCNDENSSLVSIHDSDKEYFVSSVISIFGPKNKYWIAYHNDGTKWAWDDQSTDPFTDWDVNQPNTNGGKSLCAYATQTTGLNVKWSATNCAMANLYVCESVPCRVGNKNC